MERKQHKNKSEISVLHLSEFNLPSIGEFSNKNYISFGDDNLYPQYLLELYNGSSINSAIIKGVSAMIYGEGLEATDRDNSNEHKEQWLRLKSLLRHSQKDVLKCLAFDLKLFGMCYVNVIWNKPRTKIAQIHHIPAQYIRSGKANGDGMVDSYLYSADWTNERKYKPRTYKAFNSNDRTQASQILCIKDYSPGNHYYSLPDYQGSTSYIQLDMEIAQFHLNNIKAGMFSSMVISMSNGIPSQEERRKIERQINNKFSGSQNAGRILLTFNDGKDTAPEIVPLNSNDNSESYQFLSTETTRKVLTGHRCTSPLLFGVKGDGSGFGNNADELRDSFSLFMNSVIKPMQNTLLEGLKSIFSINEIDLDLYFVSLKPADFIDIESVSKIDEAEQEKEGVEVEENVPTAEVVEDTEEVKEDVTEEVVEEPLEKEASYNGAQISSAIDIIAKVQEGVLTKEQATVFLIQFLQLPPDVAKGFFTEGDSAVEKLTESINLKKSVKKKLKSLDDIDTKPTKGMIEEAKRGLQWRKEYGRGGTAVGVARARDIANGKNLSIETIKRMNSFFARHDKNKNAEGFEPGEKGYPSAGRIAHALWGGTPGKSFAAKKVKEIDSVKENLTDYAGKVILSNLENTEVDKNEWFELGEIDAQDANTDTEEKFQAFANQHLSKHYEFANASKIPSNPDSSTSDSNAGLIRVLYRYSRNLKANSREFCKQMVRLSNAGTLYTINNLKQAKNLTVNKGFGKNGSSTYDIMKWKGGVYCHHYFVRKFYVRKRVPKGSKITIDGKTYKGGTYLPNGTLNMFRNSFLQEVNSGRFASSWKRIKDQESKRPAPTIAPINTPTRGKYN